MSSLEKISDAEEAFERARRRAGFFLAPAGFFLVWWWTSGFLSPEASRLSGVLALMVLFWLTESIPLPVTALLGAVLNIVLGVAEAKAVLAPFADPIIFIFLGGFILARAMMLHGLDIRLAMGVLSLPGVSRSPGRVLAAMGLVIAAVSMWVSNTATTAIFLPIALGVLHSMTGSTSLRGNPYATGMMLMLAYAASIGGIVTPVGSPPNLIGLGQLQKLAGVEISFFTWMSLCLPIFLVMFAVLFLLLKLLHPPNSVAPERAEPLSDYIAARRKDLGPWTPGQISTGCVFLLAVVLWIVPGIAQAGWGGDHVAVKFLNRHFPESIVALLAASFLFFLPGENGVKAMVWEEAVKIDWGIILLFGGGLSVGALMFNTGVAKAMGDAVSGWFGNAAGLWTLTAVAIAVGIILSETTSNTAAATMLCPVVIALADSFGVNPVPPTIGVCLGASMGFMLPVSTPPNAIVYGSGYVPLPAMLRAGFIFDVLGFVVIWCGLRLLCPVLGLAG